MCFCYMAQDIDDLLPETGKPDITMLIYMFFIANFLAATQDIVVDGWALTMLKKWATVVVVQQLRETTIVV